MIATTTGQRREQYWSELEPVLVTFRPSQTRIQTGSARGCFSSFESGVQTKFDGENKPSGETALYYSEAKLLYKKQSSYIIGAREGDGQAPRPPPPSEARLIAQGKARRLTLRAENWSIFVAEFYPPHFLRPSGGDEVAGSPFLQPPSAGHSSSKDKPTIQPHKNHDASTPHRLVP